MSDDYIQLVDAYWRYGATKRMEDPRTKGYQSVMGPSNLVDAPLSFNTFNAFGLMDVAHELASMKETYEKVDQFIAIQATLDQIRNQLAPGQNVTVILKSQDGRSVVQEINPIGAGYLYDPNSTLIFSVFGPDLSICTIPGENQETQTFSVKNSSQGDPRTIQLGGASTDSKSKASESADQSSVEESGDGGSPGD